MILSYSVKSFISSLIFSFNLEAFNSVVDID
nr:MAG TPA: hypothetical protein [Caudoviricetes sp.]